MTAQDRRSPPGAAFIRRRTSDAAMRSVVRLELASCICSARARARLRSSQCFGSSKRCLRIALTAEAR